MKIRLLVADDAPFIHEILRFVLKETEVEVIAEAYDGAEAVEKALSEKPDVILMDMVMPKKNGLEATREILSKLPDLRIIACSTESHETIVMQAIAAGCCDFISKPFKGKELAETIINSLKKSSGSSSEDLDLDF